MDILKFLDFIIVALLFMWLFVTDHVNRRGLTPQERKQFQEFANDIAERNIAANVAARVIQGGFTVGGFLYAGLFTALFQSALKPYVSDVFIAMAWSAVSLIAGVMNLAPLTPQSVVKNVAITRYFATVAIIQFVTIIGAFIRVFVLVLKYLQFI